MSKVFIQLNQDQSFNKFIEKFCQDIHERLFNQVSGNQKNEDKIQQQEKLFKELAFALLEQKNYLEMIKKILDYKDIIFKEFNSSIVATNINVICLMIHCIGNKDQQIQAIQFYRNFVQNENIQLNHKVKMLASLFNIFQENNLEQYEVLVQLFELLVANDKFSVALPFIQNLNEYNEKWQLNIQQRRKLYTLIINGCKHQLLEKERLNFIHKFLESYESEENFKQAEQEFQPISKILSEHFLNIESFNLNFDNILNYKVVSQIVKSKDNKLFNLVEIFLKNDLQALLNFQKSNQSYFKQINLNEEQLLKRIRLGSIVNLAEGKKLISLQQIGQHLQIPDDEIDMWIYMALEYDVIEGKINEYEKVLEIQDNSQNRYFDKQDWVNLENKVDLLINNFQGYLENIKKQKGLI